VRLVAARRLSLGKVRSGRLSYGVLGLGGSVPVWSVELRYGLLGRGG
jgi:hypothetical protein